MPWLAKIDDEAYSLLQKNTFAKKLINGTPYLVCSPFELTKGIKISIRGKGIQHIAAFTSEFLKREAREYNDVCISWRTEVPPDTCGYKGGLARPNPIKENGRQIQFTKLSTYIASQRSYTNATPSTSAPRVRTLMVVLQWLDALHSQVPHTRLQYTPLHFAPGSIPDNLRVLRTYSATPWLNVTAKSQKHTIAQLRESWATY